MINIEDKKISISRGDIGMIKLTIPTSDTTNYSFKVGDVIKLCIYNKNGYNENPLKTITTTITQISEIATINLSEADTTIGEITEKPATFWYDISLNDNQTEIGYDEEGPALFIVYPAKGGDDNANK